jgi:hypothetical protein
LLVGAGASFGKLQWLYLAPLCIVAALIKPRFALGLIFGGVLLSLASVLAFWFVILMGGARW